MLINNFYKKIILSIGLALVLLICFVISVNTLLKSFFIASAVGENITWVGGDGNWDEGNNWSGGVVPTNLDDVTIADASVTVTATTTINFASLTISGDNVVFTLSGTISSGGNITLEGPDTRFLFVGSETITGTLTIQNGSIFTGYYPSTSTPITLNSFTAADIDLHAGGYIYASGSGIGFQGGGASSDGEGSAPGIFGTTPNGSGGAHAGSGGKDAQGDLGGTGYCDFETPGTLGSGGAGGAGQNRGYGGSYLSLNATNGFIVNGSIIGNGGNSSASTNGGVDAGGGGSGSAILISADVISGTPELFTVAGGNSVGDGTLETSGEGGGGGGGCVKISYSTSNSLIASQIVTRGGYGYQRGGAGSVFIRKQDDSVRTLSLSSVNTASTTIALAAETPQTATSLSLQTLALTTSSIYTIGSGKTLTLTNDHPFQGSSPSGTIKIASGGLLKLASSSTIENVTIEIHEGGGIIDSATNLSTTLDLTIGSGATLDMRDYTLISGYLSVDSLTVASGGIVTHGNHEGLGDTMTNVVYIRANTVTINSGGAVNVDAKGFSGGQTDASDGYGTGRGVYGSASAGSGGGHGGSGGVDGDGDVGGNAYCDFSNFETTGSLGSGGASSATVTASNRNGYGGNGGGFIWLSVVDTLIVNGTISANGGNGGYFGNATEIPGGGAGGGIKLSAGTVAGTPALISAVGGSNGAPDPAAENFGGGGGGGCMLLDYTTSTSFTSTSVSLSGGVGGTESGSDGIFEAMPILRNFELKNFEPVFMGHVIVSSTISTAPSGLQVRGNYAYIGSAYTEISTGNTKGMFVADISDPTTPVIISNIVSSTMGGSNFVLSGNYVYTANPYFGGTSSGVGSFQVIDVSDPYNPVFKGNIISSPDLHRVNSMAISGNYAYIAGNNGAASALSGLKVIDISDPDHPTIVGNLNDAVNLNNLYDIVTDSHYIYGVVPGNKTFVVIDISDPTNPVLVATLEDDIKLLNATSVRIFGNYAYVASSVTDSFYIIDISDPLHPVIQGGLVGVMDGPIRMTVLGDYAFVPSLSNLSLYVLDVSNPDSPTVLHSIVSSASMSLSGIRNSAVVNGYLYTINGNIDANNFLSIFDIHNPSVSFQTEDVDQNTLSVKAEYVAGSCTYTGTSYATFSTVTSGTTSTYGTPTINNSAVDNRRILNISTASVTNNVTSTWLTTTDIPTGEGPYCMFLTPYDGSVNGNRSSASINIDLETVSPNTPVPSFSTTINSITVSWDSILATDYYVISTNASASVVSTTANTYTFSGLSDGTSYFFQVKAVDSYGNNSDYSSLSNIFTNSISGGSSPLPLTPLPPPPPPPIVLDQPTIELPLDCNTIECQEQNKPNPSGLILINNGNYYTNNRNVVLNFDVNFTDLYIVSDNDDFSNLSFSPIVSTLPYVLSDGDGTKKVYARFKNKYGVYDAYDNIILDTQIPNTPSISHVDTGIENGVLVRPPSLSGVAEANSKITIIKNKLDDLSLNTVSLASASTFYTQVDNSGNWSFTFDTLFEPGSYVLSVFTEDRAGNQSPPTDQISLVIPQSLVPEENNIVVSSSSDIVIDTTIPSDSSSGGSSLDFVTSTQIVTTSDDVKNTTTTIVKKNISNQEVLSANIVDLGNNVVKATQMTVNKVIEIVDNQEVEKINKQVVAPAVITVAVVNVVSSGFGFVQIVNFLRVFFGQFLLFSRLRKQKKWGILYNSFTKKPIDLAIIRLIEVTSSKVVKSTVTDMEGRYFFSVSPGNYILQVQKNGFGSFSQHLKNVDEDSRFINLYHGAIIKIQEESEINYNIPLDPTGTDKSYLQIIKDRFDKTTRLVLSVVGVYFSIISFVISPLWWIGCLALLQILLYVVVHHFTFRKLPSSFGMITSSENSKALQKVVVRVFDSTFNKLVETTVSDHKGRYAILLGPSKYYVTYEKEEYKNKKSPLLDFSSEHTGGLGGILVRDEVLDKEILEHENMKILKH